MYKKTVLLDMKFDGTFPLCLKRGTNPVCDCPLHCRMFDIPDSRELNSTSSPPLILTTKISLDDWNP